MKAYYNLLSNELVLISSTKITTLNLNNEDMEIIDPDNYLRIECEKPKNNLIKVNGEKVYVQFFTLKVPKLKKSKKPIKKNISGLKLIKIFNNPYISKYKLKGKNFNIGIIDGGAVFKHYEFSNGNRVKYTQNKITDDHATHVAGTFAAYGYNLNAKGVAIEANIYSYYFGNYLNSLKSLASKNINSVNNSYGYVEGWDYGNYYYGVTYEYYIENYQKGPIYSYSFGKYLTETREIDSIANQYKNFVMCFAAGNDGTDGYNFGNWYIQNQNGNWITMDPTKYPPPLNDNQQDNIGTLACAKNIITVGATNDFGLTPTDFSSSGPTDDLRIKPDIMANGDYVFSTINRGYKSYGTMSGTSMACPFATGSCLLIQQFIQEQLKYFPVSATTKACLIHGAINKTINGKYGYGLINMINTLKFLEDVLLNKSYLYNDILSDNEIKYTFNSPTLTVTLCWNDIAGQPSSDEPEKNDKSIVNQLGLYVENNGKYYYPYRLETKNGNAVQKKSDNFDSSLLVNYDNVQKIMIENLNGISNIYVKSIKFSNSQTFSLCISPSF